MNGLREFIDELDDLRDSLKRRLRAILHTIGHFLSRSSQLLSRAAQRILTWLEWRRQHSVIALLLLAFVVIAAGLDFYNNVSSVHKQVFPPPTSTATPFPSRTPIPSQTPTGTPTITPTPNATQQFLATHMPTLNPEYEPVIRTVNGVEQVWVAAGMFVMGDDFKDGMGFDDETPHPVYTDGFWIDRTLVTNQRFSECPIDICHNPASSISHKRPEGYYGVDAFDGYPVIEVIWDQANAYCVWSGGRLPTEAEWEKAAGFDPITGKTRLYPWGSQPPTSALASFDRVDLDTSSVNAHSEGASPVGAFDMAGNVWQWTADWYGEYSLDARINPTGAASGERRVVRGGSWATKEHIFLRVANRGAQNPASATNETGFRCVYDVEADD